MQHRMADPPEQGCGDPVAPRKMTFFEEMLAPAGSNPGFHHHHPQKCSVPYFTYDPIEKDEAGLAVAWSRANPGMMENRSTVSHRPCVEGQGHIVYQPYKKTSAEESHSHSPSACSTSNKHVLTQYLRSPDVSSPLASSSVAALNQTAGSRNISQTSNNSGPIAMPKAVYGQRPCCSELGCVLGQRYRVDHVAQRVPTTVYESEWMHPGAHYNHLSPTRRNSSQTLLQRKGTPFEPDGERRLMKDTTMDKCQTIRPSIARAVSAYLESNYVSYPCVPTHPLFGPLSPQSQCLQPPANSYHGLNPSHPRTFEHMRSPQQRIPPQVYRELSPMSKYGHSPQHYGFHYPEGNLRREGADVDKMQGENVPASPKHAFTNLPEHHPIYPVNNGDLSLTSTVAPPNHSHFLQGFEGFYAVPRIQINSSQRTASPNPQHSPLILQSNIITTSPISLHRVGPRASPVNVHSEQFCVRPRDTKSNGSPLSLHVEAQSSSNRKDKLNTSPSRTQLKYSPRIERDGTSSTVIHLDQPLDYSCHKVQVICKKQSQGRTGAAVGLLSTIHSDHINKEYSNDHNSVQRTDSSALVTKEDRLPSPSSTSTGVSNGKLKRSSSQIMDDRSFTPKKMEIRDLSDEHLNKRPKTELRREGLESDIPTGSPPMPVIDNVFSLAPYKAYLQTSGMLLTTRRQSADRSAASSANKLDLATREKGPKANKEASVDGHVAKEVVCCNTTTVKPELETIEPKVIKVEKREKEAESCVNSFSRIKVIPADCREVTTKEEVTEINVTDTDPTMMVIKKFDPEEYAVTPATAVLDDTSDESKTCLLTPDIRVQCSNLGGAQPPLGQINVPNETSGKYIMHPEPPEKSLHSENTVPLVLNLPVYKSVIHDLLSRTPVLPQVKPPVQPLAEDTSKLNVQTPVRRRFLMLHHCLCNIVTDVLSVSPEQELRDWLSHSEMFEPASRGTKLNKLSCLSGVKAREVWQSVEIKVALDNILQRLEEYISQKHCPFPHVKRAGAVFIPMLVVKKLLFPQVQGSFIDQVLQEHKVELRPTTLSEEKILTQLHKQAFSSKLRRLMSLKHLPDIYTDVFSLFYHVSVCKRVGVKLEGSVKEPDESSEEADGARSPAYFEVTTASPPSVSDRWRRQQNRGEESDLMKRRAKSRVRRCSRLAFLDHSSTSLADDVTDERSTHKVNTPRHVKRVTGMLDGQVAQKRFENVWTCPLSSDEFLSSEMDTEDVPPPSPLNPSSGSAKNQARPKKHSGMILKLRRVLFSKGLNSRTACYKTVSHSGTFSNLSKVKNGERAEARERRNKEVHHRRKSAKVTHLSQRRGGFSHVLRALPSSIPQRHCKALLKIRYCPYLSACHSAEHRRRWVLRSAVRRAQKTIGFFYPDLVGKMILHLYEEDDKSEVWYRGEVVRVHEAHPDPLKTVFEVRYESEPEWQYFLELLIDYKKGWLKIDD